MVAEGEGFEPSRAINPTRFPIRTFQPRFAHSHAVFVAVCHVDSNFDSQFRRGCEQISDETDAAALASNQVSPHCFAWSIHKWETREDPLVVSRVVGVGSEGQIEDPDIGLRGTGRRRAELCPQRLAGPSDNKTSRHRL
jgi:hypothetical protein